MADEFALEHWRSRALTAEKERDSARRVLARLRGLFNGGRTTLDRVREAQRVHDQEWWTRDHAMNAVAEGIAGVMTEADPSGSVDR